jgi:hypothetical protein
MGLNAKKQREIWIGMVEVRPFDTNLLAGMTGAFVNVLTWAVDLEEFHRKAEELMNHTHLEILAIDNAEPLANRGPVEQLDEEIARIAADVRYNPNAIMYSTFHTWRNQVQ